MCLPGLGIPKPQTIAPPPAPPAQNTQAPVLGAGDTDLSSLQANRRGRSSLRIDLASGGPLSDGTGLTIPQ